MTTSWAMPKNQCSAAIMIPCAQAWASQTYSLRWSTVVGATVAMVDCMACGGSCNVVRSDGGASHGSFYQPWIIIKDSQWLKSIVNYHESWIIIMISCEFILIMDIHGFIWIMDHYHRFISCIIITDSQLMMISPDYSVMECHGSLSIMIDKFLSWIIRIILYTAYSSTWFPAADDDAAWITATIGRRWCPVISAKHHESWLTGVGGACAEEVHHEVGNRCPLQPWWSLVDDWFWLSLYH